MKNCILFLFFSLMIVACSPTEHVRGNLLEDYRIADVRPGVSSRQDVLQALGSPTTMAPFDEKTWYYLGQETEKHGILDPEVVNERIVAVTFDDSGIVQNIGDVDAERADLPYVERTTPTSGNDVTAVQQFLGNLGKFNSAGGG